MSSVMTRSGNPYTYTNASLSSSVWTKVTFGGFSQAITIRTVTQNTYISFNNGESYFTVLTAANFLQFQVRCPEVWLKAATATSDVQLVAAVEPSSA